MNTFRTVANVTMKQQIQSVTILTRYYDAAIFCSRYCLLLAVIARLMHKQLLRDHGNWNLILVFVILSHLLVLTSVDLLGVK